MTVLQKLLQENGYNIPVVNKTLQGGGTLSMMKRAGVDDQIIQNLFLSIRKQPMARSFMLQKQESVILRKKTLPVTIWTISLLYLWDIMAAGIMIRLSLRSSRSIF